MQVLQTAEKASQVAQKFGTTPVFLAAISTILGAVLFLRFPYAVGHLGFWGALGIIVLAHLVTIPTALAVAEIATNRRVEGGGEYYIISRSFGKTIGGTIGFWLYVSQAVSVAFYMIAFGEAFQGLWPWIESWSGLQADARFISIPTALLLVIVITRVGSSLGVGMLIVVCATLLVSLTLFFLGGPNSDAPQLLGGSIEDSDPFVQVFAIVFPAFTGMTAGVGLSGDLQNPRRSIPLGTLSATLAGMAIYAAVVVKLSASVSPDALANTDRLVMQDIALWPPIIPIGLAAASLSSAIGSILVAPRTLQALGRDRVFPWRSVNDWVATGAEGSDEPKRATVISGAFALLCIFAGDIDLVSQVITMFFMITYGTLCTVSVLEHFAGNPSYRPTFRSRWYVSLVGAVMAFMLMFQIQPLYALLSLAMMFGLYQSLAYTRKHERDVGQIIRGVMFQLTRRLQISIQKTRAGTHRGPTRPAFVAVAPESDGGIVAFDLLRWICHRQGFGQYIRFIQGEYSLERTLYARISTDTLIQKAEESQADIFVDTVVAPDYHSGLAQAIQRPGISGLPNNSVLLDFARNDKDELERVVNATRYLAGLHYNICILRSSGRRFGYRSNIHIWLTADELEGGDTARLMVLLAYIILGHKEWAKAEIRIFACFPAELLDQETEVVETWIIEGRLPISPQNLSRIPYRDAEGLKREVRKLSKDADLVVMGINPVEIAGEFDQKLARHPDLGEVLFVNAGGPISIS